MMRPLVVFGLVLGLAAVTMSTATGRVIDAGRLGSLPLVLPEGEVHEVVFLFSDLTGWNADLDQAAARLSESGGAVLEVDLPGYLARLEESDDHDCHYLISEIEATSKQLQRELGLTRYLSPILAGTGMGAALAYAALAQAPAATIAGAASDGLATELATQLPLCPGAPASDTGSGFDYGPKADLPGWWRLGVPPEQKTSAERFVAGIAKAEVVEVPDDAGLDDRLAALLTTPLGTPAGSASLGELPLVELPASGPGDLMAVFYSGDGGWRDLDKEIAGRLQAEGIPVVGVDSLRYFWSEKTPEQVAADLATILAHYRVAWRRPDVLLVGYSFGADVLPFAYNRLPEDAKARVRRMALLGLAPTADFEIHVTGWLGVEAHADSRPTAPELARIPPELVQCFYGAEEDDTACTLPELEGAELVRTPGGHHFDGDYGKLADAILAGMARR
jgi:type IV secretory pathway VirJ component